MKLNIDGKPARTICTNCGGKNDFKNLVYIDYDALNTERGRTRGYTVCDTRCNISVN